MPTLLNHKFWAEFNQDFQDDKNESLKSLIAVGQEMQRVRELSATSLQGKVIQALEACENLLKSKDKAQQLPRATEALAKCRKLLQDKSQGSVGASLEQLTAEWKAEHALHSKHITAATTAVEDDDEADFKVIRLHSCSN